MKHNFIFFLVPFLIMGSIQGKTSNFKKLQNSIFIQFDDISQTGVKALKITVYSDNIIHVSASPVDTFSQRESLIVEKKPDSVDWTLKEYEGHVVISTSKIETRVNLNTGEITFYDKTNHLILAEKKGGGKTLTPVEIDGEKTFNVRQEFEPNPEEAFYGLGQHQTGIMNYKGHTVDLWQRNTTAVVPFLVSSAGYGILWDNYSFTKFGDIGDTVKIPPKNLYDINGKAGGLTQEDNKWIGELRTEAAGVYIFKVRGNRSAKVKINSHTVIDQEVAEWIREIAEGRILLDTHRRYNIEVQGIHPEQLIWQTPGPEKYLYTSLWSEVGDQIDYHFIYGPELDSVISGYRKLTGSATMLPRTAFGFWQSRERYKTSQELLYVVKEFRRRKVPIDYIVQDYHYWQTDKWGSHEFDTLRFPDPVKMIDQLHEQNVNIMISVWPKFYKGTEHFNRFYENGWLYKSTINTKDWIGFEYAFYDALNEQAGALFWKQISEHLFTKGIDAWWLDATEPELTVPMTPDMLRGYMILTGMPGSGARYLNVYSLFNSKAVYDGQRKADLNRRIFILTRSAFAGQQKYAATWSGDVHASWSTLKAQISAGLNFCLSGIPYWTVDIGGFTVTYENPQTNEDWFELYTRWYQFGAFCPIFRSHGSNTPREIWYFGESGTKYYDTQLKFNYIRYRLLLYIYSTAARTVIDDYTMMRPLVMDFRDDRNVYNISDQYMFGPYFLINPVTEPEAKIREVYLPGGSGWYDFWTGKFFNGGQTINADTPIETMPIFVKAGAIVPVGPFVQYATEKPDAPVELRIYPGADGEFKLYEDENDNYNYEKGLYSLIRFHYDDKNKRFTIRKREGSFRGMIHNRTFRIVTVKENHGTGIDTTEKPDKIVKYDGDEIRLKLE